MAMLIEEITRRRNKFWNEVIECMTLAMAASMVAFTTWQLWVQYFVTPAEGK
jgi:hypothetical protein